MAEKKKKLEDEVNKSNGHFVLDENIHKNKSKGDKSSYNDLSFF